MSLQTGLYIIALGVQLLTTGFTVAMFCVIKFNDLKHLSEDVHQLVTIQHGLMQRVSKLEGKLEK